MVGLGITLWLMIGCGVGLEEWDEQGHSLTYFAVCMILWPILLGIMLVQAHHLLCSKEDKE